MPDALADTSPVGVPASRQPWWRIQGRGLAMVLAALIGVTVCLCEFDHGFLDGSGRYWEFPFDDQAAYLSAAAYHLHDHWRLPLFAIPAMGYPDGGRVIFNDAVPLGALLAKILYSLTGTGVNYLGWWPLLVYVLQGVMAARAGLAVLCVPFIIRFVHFAMMSQFVIPWALALYVEQIQAERPAVVEPTLLVLVAILISPYLAAMVIPILGAAWLTLAKDGHLSVKRLWRPAALAAVTVLVVMAIAGFFSMPGKGSVAITAYREFGVWSWNLATLVVPRWDA